MSMWQRVEAWGPHTRLLVRAHVSAVDTRVCGLGAVGPVLGPEARAGEEKPGPSSLCSKPGT